MNHHPTTLPEHSVAPATRHAAGALADYIYADGSFSAADLTEDLRALAGGKDQVVALILQAVPYGVTQCYFEDHEALTVIATIAFAS